MNYSDNIEMASKHHFRGFFSFLNYQSIYLEAQIS